MNARLAPVRGGALLGLAFALALPGAAVAQVVIDEFTTNQATLSDPPGGASTVAGGADILGQHRDLQVKRLAGAGPVTAGVAGGLASFAVTATMPDSAGLAQLTWDGDSDPLVVDPTGLGSVDLTGGGAAAGFQLTIASASAGLGLRIEVWTDAGNASQAMRTLPAIAAPTIVFVAYSEFSPTLGTGADFNDVGAVRLTLYGGNGHALALDRIVTGTPVVAALKADFDTSGVPLASVTPGGIVRYRVTITNTGSEARAVDLTDVIDPNTALASAVRSTPIVRVDQYQALADLPFDSAAAGAPSLVANDGDPDGNAVVAVPAAGQATARGGTVTIQADGSFVYTPAAGFLGVDSFTYQIAAVAGDPMEDANGNPIGATGGAAYLLVVPQPPTVTAGGTLAYTENDPPTAIDTTITVTDPDSNVVGATAQITGNYVNGEDVLSCGAPCAGLSPTFVAASGTLTLSGSATPAAYQTALRGVAYENGSEAPSTLDRTVTWIADDGFGTSAPVTSTVTIAAVNDPPVVTTSGGSTSFVEGGGAVVVDAALTLADVDDVNLESATVTLTNPQNGVPAGAESLSVPTPGASCPGLAVPGPGQVLAITGSATVAIYQGCLRAVVYDNSSQNPTASPDRVVSFLVNDGDNDSNTATKTVTVTPVNDPPVAGADAWDTAGNTRLVVDLPALATPHVRDTTPSTFGVLDNDSDPAEGDAVAVSGIVGCADATPPFGDAPACVTANGGSVVMEANGRFTYTPPAGTVTDDTFQYVLTDDGTPAPASSNGTVTIHFLGRVWYVQNNAPGGGTGRSNDPFDTLVEAQTASAANDWIFVRFGDGTATGQSAGIVLKAGQHLVGEHAGLSVPANFNGNGTNQVLFAAVAGNRPLIDNSGVGNNAVAATDAIPTEIVGLSLLSVNANAIDLTFNPAFAGSGTVTILNNVVRGAGAEGIDVNAGGTGTLTATISGNFWNTAGTHTGNAIDVARTGGLLRVGLSANSVLSAAIGINVAGGAAASTAVTAFSSNSVHQTTGGSGLVVSNATFDADPNQAGYQPIPGGTTTVGIPGDGVGGAAMALTSVAGDLSFTDLDLFGVSGLVLSGTGAVNVGAGTGLRLAVPAGVATFQATAGPAVDASGATVDLQLAGMSSSGSPTTGVSLVNVADGTSAAVFSAPPGSTIANATGTAFNLDGGNATVTYNGTITNSAGRSVVVQNRTGDTAAFTGGITDTGSGVLVNANNAAATTSFRGGLSLSTGANAAFTATNGGQLEICDENPCNPGATGGLVNTLATTTATALNVATTTISANNLELRSVSSNGGSGNGIILATTGASGGLKVKGTGTAGSGGTIANKTGADGSSSQGSGIFLDHTAGVSLSRMQLNDFQNFAIRGLSVNGFTLANCVVSGTNGTNEASPFNEGSIRFDELTGTASVSGGDISGGRQRNIWIDNTTGTLGLTVDGASIHNTGTIVGDDGLGVEIGGGNATIVVTNAVFSAHGGDHFNLSLLGSPTVDLTFTGNLWSGGHVIGLGQGLFVLGASFNGDFTYDISNNGTVAQPLVGNRQGGAIHVNKGSGTGTFSGTIANNVIGDPAVNGSGSSEASGLDVEAHGAGGSHTTLISNNLVRQFHNDGILVLAGEGNATLNATVTGNTVSNPDATLASLHGMHFNIGTLPTDALQACLEVSNNALTNAGNEPNGGVDLRMRQRQLTTVRLPGYGGANNDNAAVQTFLTTTKANAVTTILVSNSVAGGGGGFVGGAACPTP